MLVKQIALAASSWCLALTIACQSFAWPLPAERLQHQSFLSWAKEKEAEVRSIDESQANEWQRFNLPSFISIQPRLAPSPGEEREKEIEATATRYFKVFGRDKLNSFIWTGIDTANPLTRAEDYRWDLLKESGLHDPSLRDKLITKLKASGIVNIRLGLPNHEISLDQPETWEPVTRIIESFHSAGFRISLDMHHFGIEDRFKKVDAHGKVIREESYYLNPEWPVYFADFAAEAYRRYHNRIHAITLINEPEVTVGFNAEFWHGGFPGWSSPDGGRYHFERALRVGEAAVRARLKIEEVAKQVQGDKPIDLLFLHTEATAYKPYWAEFNEFVRFIPSDMILGQDWLLSSDPDAIAATPLHVLERRWDTTPASQRSVLDYLIRGYVFWGTPSTSREALRDRLAALLKQLKGLHVELGRQFGKSMRTDTILGVDYYAHNEDKTAAGDKLDPEPQNYAPQVRSGGRAGLYPIIMDYFRRYPMPVMIGETGTPYYHYGAKWTQQMLLECAKAAESGIPFLGVTVYPAVDTHGWEMALSRHRREAQLNPSGLVDHQMELRPFVRTLMDSLKKRIPED